MNDIHPHAVEARLERLLTQLEEQTEAYSSLVVDAAIKEAEYRVGYASAIVSSKAKTIAEKEAEALLRCDRELMARRTAEARAEAAKMAVFSLRTQCEGLRTIVASSRQLAS